MKTCLTLLFVFAPAVVSAEGPNCKIKVSCNDEPNEWIRNEVGSEALSVGSLAECVSQAETALNRYRSVKHYACVSRYGYVYSNLDKPIPYTKPNLYKVRGKIKYKKY